MIEQQTKTPPLPKGWVLTSIGEITEVIRGASPRPKGDPRYFGGNIPWIKISDVSKEKGKYVSKTKDTVTEEGAAKSRLLQKGTLILSNSGTVCVPKILAVNGCIHDGFVAFPHLTKNVDMFFLYYYFEYIRPRIVQENRQGVTQVNLNTKIVRNIPFLLPPISEQARIVCKLEELFTRLDAGVASLQNVKAQLQLYRQAVLKHAFNGKLTEEWRKTHKNTIHPATKLLEQIKQEYKQKKPTNTSQKIESDDLQKIPNEWRWVNLGLCCDILSGQAFKSKDFIESDGVPVIKIRNIGYSEFIWQNQQFLPKSFLKDYSRYVIEPETILMALTRPITNDTLKVALYPSDAKIGLLNQRVASITPSKYFLKIALLYYFQSQIFKNQVKKGMSETLQPNLSPITLRNLWIPLMSLPEQIKIIEEVERQLALIDETTKTVEENIFFSKQLRQSILKTAFEGKLVAQINNDESAERLLERINQEKEK